MTAVEEPIETTLARLDALADLSMSPACPTCDAAAAVVARNTASIPVAYGITHEAHCPEYVAW